MFCLKGVFFYLACGLLSIQLRMGNIFLLFFQYNSMCRVKKFFQLFIWHRFRICENLFIVGQTFNSLCLQLYMIFVIFILYWIYILFILNILFNVQRVLAKRSQYL